MGYFLMLVAVSIASVAAYFSVYGLAHIFAATFWSVVLMGGVLEIGKLVATSFLYRFWSDITFALRSYLFVAIIGLMVLTSAGIFGYLSNAYQQDIVGVKDVAARIELIDTELASLTAREQAINDDIARIGSNYVTARQNMIKQYGPEKNKITTRIADIRSEKLELSTKQLAVEAHTGPIIYIAKAMDKGVDDAVVWMICLIIFVFDPLAVALTIGANVALTKQRKVFVKPDDDARENISTLPTSPVYEYENDAIRSPLAVTTMNAVAAHAIRQSPQPSATTFTQQIPAGMSLVNTNEHNALREMMVATADEMLSLESDIADKQRMVETLSQDNIRLEDELFVLAGALEKKDASIGQLKLALLALEQEPRPLNIQQRAALHESNKVSSKTT